MHSFFIRAIFILSLACPGQSFSQAADIEILRNIHIGRNDSFDPACRFVSQTAGPLSIAIPLVITGTGSLKRDSLMTRKGIVMAAGGILAATISTSLKYGINRPRPYQSYPDIVPATTVHTPSFPSGHSSSSFGLATSFTLAYPKWYVAVPSFLWAGSMAYSRMHLGVHYPTDVLAGALIGSGSAWLSFYINKKLSSRK